MTRLIDADKVISLWDKYHYSIATHAIEFDDELRKLPTVDAEPVRHGEWIGGDLGYCTACGHEGCASDIWDGCTGMYCPNCGAKMDGERKEK